MAADCPPAASIVARLIRLRGDAPAILTRADERMIWDNALIALNNAIENSARRRIHSAAFGSALSKTAPDDQHGTAIHPRDPSLPTSDE